jgi:site-specific DNA-adenine methylase
MGGGNVTKEIAKRIVGSQVEELICTDISGHLMQLYKDCFEEKWPRDDLVYVSKKEYTDLREKYHAQNVGTVELTSREILIGYACSYSGFFGAYAEQSTQNYYTDALNSIKGLMIYLRALKLRPCLFAADFLKYDPFAVDEDLRGVCIYCDPPYYGTQWKGYAGPRFRHTLFWDRCRYFSRKGARVYVAEYNAPADFSVIWEGTKPMMMSNTKTERPGRRIVERLFLCNHSCE